MEIEYFNIDEMDGVLLGEHNHILSSRIVAVVPKRYYNITGISEDFFHKGKSFTIKNWKENNNRELVLYKENGEIIGWEPNIEKIYREEFIREMKDEGRQIFDINQGYINGRDHYTGSLDNRGKFSENTEPGYILWIELLVSKLEGE